MQITVKYRDSLYRLLQLCVVLLLLFILFAMNFSKARLFLSYPSRFTYTARAQMMHKVGNMPKQLKTGLWRGACLEFTYFTQSSSSLYVGRCRRMCPICTRCFSSVRAVCAHVRFCAERDRLNNCPKEEREHKRRRTKVEPVQESEIPAMLSREDSYKLFC